MIDLAFIMGFSIAAAVGLGALIFSVEMAMVRETESRDHLG